MNRYLVRTALDSDPTCGLLLGYQKGRHCRCVLVRGHDGPHVDRSGGWWM